MTSHAESTTNESPVATAGPLAHLLMAALAMGVLVVAAAGCGQTASAHAMMSDSPNWFTAPGGVAPTPNGENVGPAPGTLTYKYTVTTITGTSHRPGGGFIANPLQRCPVWGRGSFSDDFGAPR